MSPSFENAGWPACHSALRLDRWMAGELTPAEGDELSAHVEGCARCRAAVSFLERVREEAELPPLRATPAARGRSWAWRAALGAGAMAAAATALVLFFHPEAGDVRLKGSAPTLSVYVQHGDRLRRAGPGERLAPGDVVRFAASSPQSAFVAVLSLDPAGRASIDFPTDGGRAVPLKAGADVPLPAATRLDGAVGQEQVFGLFCDRPVDLEPVRVRLDAVAAGLVPAGCQVTRWTFEKR